MMEATLTPNLGSKLMSDLVQSMPSGRLVQTLRAGSDSVSTG